MMLNMSLRITFSDGVDSFNIHGVGRIDAVLQKHLQRIIEFFSNSGTGHFEVEVFHNDAGILQVSIHRLGSVERVLDAILGRRTVSSFDSAESIFREDGFYWVEAGEGPQPAYFYRDEKSGAANWEVDGEVWAETDLTVLSEKPIVFSADNS